MMYFQEQQSQSVIIVAAIVMHDSQLGGQMINQNFLPI